MLDRLGEATREAAVRAERGATWLVTQRRLMKIRVDGETAGYVLSPPAEAELAALDAQEPGLRGCVEEAMALVREFTAARAMGLA